jgi:hypothetical protein
MAIDGKVDFQRFRRAFSLAMANEFDVDPLVQDAAKKEIVNQMPMLMKELNRFRKMEKLRKNERDNMVHGAINVGSYKIPLMIPQEEQLEQGETFFFGKLALVDFINDDQGNIDQCNIILNDIEIKDIEKAKALEDKVVSVKIREYIKRR